MKVNVSNTWKIVLPSVNVAGTWRNAQRAFLNVAGTWYSVAEPTSPVLIDAVAKLAWNYVYGPRLGYVPSYNPPGSLTPASLNLYNPYVNIANVEYGSNDYSAGNGPGGPWRWFTFVFVGNYAGLPFPMLGSFGEYVLHFHSVIWQPEYNSTRVWYRCYVDLPQDEVQRTFRF